MEYRPTGEYVRNWQEVVVSNSTYVCMHLEILRVIKKLSKD
jgi:hypothetical protein